MHASQSKEFVDSKVIWSMENKYYATDFDEVKGTF
jgi:hypothetical protein